MKMSIRFPKGMVSKLRNLGDISTVVKDAISFSDTSSDTKFKDIIHSNYHDRIETTDIAEIKISDNSIEVCENLARTNMTLDFDRIKNTDLILHKVIVKGMIMIACQDFIQFKDQDGK